jgi:uncharacterized membrane protein YdjX (TVP38/TMEM64 family)
MTMKFWFTKPTKSQINFFIRLLLLFVLAAGFLTFFCLGWDRYLSFQAMSENKELLSQWSDENYFMSVLLFIGAYSVLSAFSVPTGVWMTMVGGFMFGTLAGGLFSLLGATIGAMVIFFIARYTLAAVFRKKCGEAIISMEAGFKENELSYMLVLRLVPLFPFWLINLVPAFLDVTPRAYLIGTLLGMIPGALVYASVGNGLSAIFESGIEPDIGIIFSPNIIIPIIGLTFLALIPVFYKLREKCKIQN